MALVQGLQSGLIQGLQDGLGSIFGGRKLLDLNFSAPRVQAWNIASATYQWTMQETTGVYADANGDTDADLTLTGSGLLRGRTAVGLWDGSSMTARKCLEEPIDPVQGTDYLEAAANTVLDGATSMACLVVYRMHRQPTYIDAYPANKRNSGGAGWWIRFRNGSLSLRTWDTVTEKFTAELAPSTTGALDGGWHYLLAVIDQTAKTIRLYTDGGNTSAVSISGADSIGNTDKFRFGTGTGGETPESMQVAYMAGWDGAAAETAATDVANWWVFGGDPTGKLATYTRASMTSCTVNSAGQVCHYSGLSSTPQLPFAYHTDAPSSNGIGLATHRTHTNLIDYSEDIAGQWTAANATLTGLDGDDPAGFKSCSSITATAANGQAYRTFTTVAATEYTLSFWVKKKTGSTDTGRLVFYDETGAAELAAQAFTATTAWQRITVTATTNAGQVSSSLRVEVDTNTEAVYAWGAQAVADEWAQFYLRTSGATATAAGTLATVSNTSDVAMSFAAATVKFEGILLGTPASSYLLRAYNGGTIYNEIRAQDTARFRSDTNDSAGAAGVSAFFTAVGGDITDGFEFDLEFDATNAFNGSWHALATLDGVETSPGAQTAPWTPGSGGTLAIGYASAASNVFIGLISRLRIWDETGEG